MDDSGAKLLVADPEMAEQIAPLRATLPDLEHVVVADREVERCEYRTALSQASSKRPEVEIDRFDPAALA